MSDDTTTTTTPADAGATGTEALALATNELRDWFTNLAGYAGRLLGEAIPEVCALARGAPGPEGALFVGRRLGVVLDQIGARLDTVPTEFERAAGERLALVGARVEAAARADERQACLLDIRSVIAAHASDPVPLSLADAFNEIAGIVQARGEPVATAAAVEEKTP